jgi:hypothetical protein
MSLNLVSSPFLASNFSFYVFHADSTLQLLGGLFRVLRSMALTKRRYEIKKIEDRQMTKICPVCDAAERWLHAVVQKHDSAALLPDAPDRRNGA